MDVELGDTVFIPIIDPTGEFAVHIMPSEVIAIGQRTLDGDVVDALALRISGSDVWDLFQAGLVYDAITDPGTNDWEFEFRGEDVDGSYSIFKEEGDARQQAILDLSVVIEDCRSITNQLVAGSEEDGVFTSKYEPPNDDGGDEDSEEE